MFEKVTTFKVLWIHDFGGFPKSRSVSFHATDVKTTAQYTNVPPKILQ